MSLRSILNRLTSKKSDLEDDDIGLPYELAHVRHIDIDNRSSTGFKGLPEKWRTLLKVSGISKEEAMSNSKQVLAVLEFHTKGPRKMPTSAQVAAEAEEVVKLTETDPAGRFRDKVKIGQGANGKVYACLDNRTGKKCAIKMSSIEQVDLEDLKREIAMHAVSQHENIVRYHEAYLFDDRIWIVLELVEGGNVTDLIDESSDWPEDHIAYCLHQVLRGLSYLHSKFRLHRDIKSDNILWNKHGEVKLADFGYAISLTNEKQDRNSVVGTPYWMAPEIILSEPYTYKVDVWSTGVTAYEIATGRPPFMNELPLRALYLISVEPAARLPDNGQWSGNLVHFVANTLVKNPKERASADQCLMHPLMGNCCTAKTFSEFALDRKKSNSEPAGSGALQYY